jgi:hypothetical protein
MRAGRAFGFALSFLLYAGSAGAQETYEPLLSCAAEFQARAIYAESLGLADAGHISFLMGRSEIFLSLAEAVGPREMISCPGDRGPVMDLVICLSPKDLSADRSALVSERLIELANANRGNLRLEACMVDETCAECMRLFNRMVREHSPMAWDTTPP